MQMPPQPQNATFSQPVPQAWNPAPEPPKKKSKKPLIAIAAVLIVVALGACRVQCKIWARCETIPFSRTMQRMAHRAVLSIPKRFAPATTLNFSKVGYGT